jgi:hypothetical protein
MKTTKLFRAVAPVLLAFVLFLSANVAKAQYYGGNPVYASSQVPTNGNVITAKLSADNYYITFSNFKKTTYDFSPSPAPTSVIVYIQVRDASGAAVGTFSQGYPNGDTFGIYGNDQQRTVATGFGGISFPGYTYQIVGVLSLTNANTQIYYYDANTYSVN